MPSKWPSSESSAALKTSSIGILRSAMPRLSASAIASSRLPSDEYRDGMETPTTFSAPSASTATAATRLESMPPDSATSALPWPDLRT